MDLDREFIRAVVREGKPALLAAIDRGVSAGDHLYGDGKKAWEYLGSHWKEYREIPSVEVIESKVACSIDGSSSESAQFFLDEIFKRRLFFLCRDGTENVTKSLDERDPQAAAEAWSEIHHKIQSENLTVKKVESLLSLGKQLLSDYNDAKAGKMGIPTPWSTMDDQTLGWWPEDLALFVGRLGVGKCTRANTLIQDSKTGIQRTIKDVCENPDATMVTTWSKEKGIHPAEITAKVDTGHKECLKFLLGTGRSIEVTPEHPFLTPDGWKRADGIAEGDSVAVAANMPFPVEPKAMQDAEVDLLAIMLADGSCTHGHVEFTKGDPEIIRIASEAALFLGAEVVPRKAQYQYGIRSGADSTENPALELIRKHGIAGNKSTEKTIPDAIFRLGKEQLARFLTVFWMCDGYVDSRGPAVVLASEKMLEQIQSLLLRFGIQSRISEKPSKCNGKTFAAWRLRVYSFCHERFEEVFDLWGDREVALGKVVAKERNSNVGFPRLSKELRTEIEELSRSKAGRWSGGLLKQVGERLGWASKFMTRSLFGKDDSLLLGRFKVFCEVYGCEDKYRWLWESDLYWDSVESIEDVGEQKIYDLTVAPTSCFVANDIVVHNTWLTVICAHKAWAAGNSVLFVSTEMHKMQIARRFFALNLRMPYNDVRRGRLGEFVEEKFFAGVEEMMKGDGINIVAGDFDYTIDNLAAVVMDESPDLLCVDGPYLIKNSGRDRHERVSNTFDDMKSIGKKAKHATITNLQFNRSAKTGQSNTIAAENIGVTDVAGWNCDVAYGLLQTDEMVNTWEMGVKALKIREGKGGEFMIRWNHEAMDFSEIDGEGGGSGDDSGSAPAGESKPPPSRPVSDKFEDLPF